MIEPFDDGLRLAQPKGEHQLVEAVISAAGGGLERAAARPEQGSLPVDQRLDSRQREELEKVEAGEEFEPDVAQVGRRPVEPVEKLPAAGFGEVVNLPGRAAGLELFLDGDPAGCGELFELRIEVAAAEAPDAAEGLRKVLVQLIAVLGACHQEAEQGRLG